ncbi:MAG: efflux RND transporter periplasmic adaptor subunit [Pseudomonadota bacterium]
MAVSLFDVSVLRNTKRQKRDYVPSACIIIAVLVLASACSQQTEDTFEAKPRPIKLIVTEKAGTEFPVSFPAVVEASQSSVLTFQVSGLLQDLPVREGQQLNRGDLIGRLNQRDFQSNLNSARAQYENADTEYQRASRLAEQDAISRSVLDQRKSQRDITFAAFQTAQKALDDTVLRAPFDGSVAEIFTENFQNVSAQEPIITLQSGGSVDAVVDVPARIVARVPEIDPIGTVMTLDAAPNIEIEAEFKESSGQSDPTTQTYRARFSFDPPDNLLVLPGMTGKIESRFVYSGDDIDFGVSVPASAILSDGEARFVWVVDQDSMTVSKRPVTLAVERFVETVSVIEGLEGGEVIAGAGASYLVDGMEVRAWDGADTLR